MRVWFSSTGLLGGQGRLGVDGLDNGSAGSLRPVEESCSFPRQYFCIVVLLLSYSFLNAFVCHYEFMGLKKWIWVVGG